jgi:putative inorganic carbon (HCO3(-)) transporter
MSWPGKVIRFSFNALFFLVPLIFLPYTSELFEFNKIVVTYIFTIIIVGAWATQIVWDKHFSFRRTHLDWPIIIFLISQLLSLFFSIDTRTSWLGYYSRFNGGVVSLVCYAMLYWAFVTHIDRRSTLSLLKTSFISTLLVCLWGVAEHLGIDAKWWVQDVRNRVFSTLGQPNWLAAYLVTLIFIPIAKTLEFKKTSFNWLYAFLAVLMFITLVFTRSRSGLLAFAVSSAFFWGITLLKTSFKSLKTALLLNSVFLLAIVIFPNPVRELFYKEQPVSPTTIVSPSGPALEIGGTESKEIRSIVWKGALAIWRSSGKAFWIGTGPETFAMAYYQHRPAEHNATSEWELLYNKAHNEFLNYLATTGLLGLGSYLVLLGFTVYVFINSIFNSKNDNTDSYILNCALFASWLSIPVTNYFGFSVVIIQILMLLLPAFAITLNRIPSKNSPVKIFQLGSSQIIGTLLVFSITGYGLFAVAKYWVADTYYATAEKDVQAFGLTQELAYISHAYDQLSEAYSLNSKDSPIAAELGVMSANMAEAGYSTPAAQMIKISLAASQKAVNQSPYHPNFYKLQARGLLILSLIDPQYLTVADNVMAKVQIISPTDPRIPYNRALIAQRSGDNIRALDFLNQALQMKPDFADALGKLKEIASPSAQTTP